MEKITNILRKKDFTKSVEFVPIRNGENYKALLEKIRCMSKTGIDFISITNSAGGSLRGGTLPISYFANTKHGMNTLTHFTCMDCSKEQIESTLMDYHYMEVKNILALRGDSPVGCSISEWKGEYKFAWQMVRQISALNNGQYLTRAGVDKDGFREGERTDFCIGVAAHPEEDNLDKEISYLKMKVESGAEFAITQMLFDAKLYKSYVDLARKSGITIPIIPGVRPLTKFDKIAFTENLFRVKVSDDFKEGIKGLNEKDAYDFGIGYTIELCKKLRENGAPGVHLFLLNDVAIGERIISSL